MMPYEPAVGGVLVAVEVAAVGLVTVIGITEPIDVPVTPWSCALYVPTF
jgi:hypothetical protein